MGISKFGLAVSAMAMAMPAHAWNSRGHMTVAAVAWCHMTKNARHRASDLIKLNPDRQQWVEKIPAPQQDQAAFLVAATWPDDIRSKYQDDGYVPKEPIASQNIGYTDHYVHAYWHFKDIPFSPDGTPTEEALAPNAVTQINVFRSVIGSPSVSDDVKSYDLVWLLHLVGDMHQPLHATSRFTASKRKGDNGGNGVKVCLPGAKICSLEKSSKLHSLWDAAVGTGENIPNIISFAMTLRPLATDNLNDLDADSWAQHSQMLAVQYAYAPPIGIDKQAYRITQKYRDKAGSIAQSQIAKGGMRLAMILNAAFDPQATVTVTPGVCQPQ